MSECVLGTKPSVLTFLLLLSQQLQYMAIAAEKLYKELGYELSYKS
jgi:hypothetical protein